jgi:hypothetical protein
MPAAMFECTDDIMSESAESHGDIAVSSVVIRYFSLEA